MVDQKLREVMDVLKMKPDYSGSLSVFRVVAFKEWRDREGNFCLQEGD